MSSRDVTFTVYTDREGVIGTIQSRPWPEWVRTLTTHDVRPEKDGPAVVLGKVVGERAGVNVAEVHAFGIDVEKRPDNEVSRLLDVLAPFEFVLYTTHRNGTEPTPRIRIVLPLDAPLVGIDPKEHKVNWSRLNMLALGMNDPSTKDVGRLHYLPSTGTPEHAWSFHNQGRFISLGDLPAHMKSLSRTPSKTDVTQAVEKLRRVLKVVGKEHALKPGIMCLLIGEEFAAPGARHEWILELTWHIASTSPKAPPVEAVCALFEASLSKMDTDQTLVDVANAYNGALVKVEELNAEHKEARETEARAVQLHGSEPYSPDDLATIGTKQGVTADELAARWIIQRDSTFYVLQSDGYYSAPCSMMEARPVASRLLARAPILLNEPTRQSVRRRGIIELVEDYGQKADNVLADLTAQHSTFDAKTSTMYEAVCPRRDLVPTFDKRIDSWLKLLGGTQYEKLLDWLAIVPDLSKLLCALYIAGKSGAGKSLLPVGLAKLWTSGGPTEIEKVLDNYNEDLSRCPLIFADEAIPKKWKGNPTTTVLRSIIAGTTRTLTRKYKSSATLNGAVRVVLAANNEFLLQDADDAPGANDREAVARRFLYIEAHDDVSHYVENIERTFSIQEEWIDNGGIARHALWLAANRPVKQQGRFWVMGTESTMSRRLAVGGSDWNQWVCEWLVRYLLNPNPVEAKRDGKTRRGDGELLINAQAISDGWNIYLKIKRDPDTHRIGAALSAVSIVDGKKGRVQRRWSGAHVWYHRIDLENLVDWSNRNGIGDEETIRAAVTRPTPVDAPVTKNKLS